MFGIVHLVYRSDGSNKFLDKLSGQKIQISFFVNNWKENELIQDIRKFAPQATIPPEINNRFEVKTIFRPMVLLLYYLLCMVVLLLPILSIPDRYFQSFKYAWDLSGFGLMGGIFGGMLTLLEYGAWLDTKPTDKEIRIIAMILYILPFSGWVIVFITGIFLQQVVALEEGGRYLGIVNLLALLIGALQFKIISKVVKRYIWI